MRQSHPFIYKKLRGSVVAEFSSSLSRSTLVFKDMMMREFEVMAFSWRAENYIDTKDSQKCNQQKKSHNKFEHKIRTNK